jgi:hypothetical protein
MYFMQFYLPEKVLKSGHIGAKKNIFENYGIRFSVEQCKFLPISKLLAPGPYCLRNPDPDLLKPI